MSFRCQRCKEPQPTGTRPTLRVVETRLNERAGYGTQIVKELTLCAPCDTIVVDQLAKIQEEQEAMEKASILKASMADRTRSLDAIHR